MTQDILLRPDNDGVYDLRVVDSEYEKDDSFATSIIVSLFTDARSSQVEDPSKRRGWVGDILTAEVGRSLGSTIWLFEQSRIDQTIAEKIRSESQNALFWMVQDGIAKSVSVTIDSVTLKSISLNIFIKASDGLVLKYNILWSNTNAAKFSKL